LQFNDNFDDKQQSVKMTTTWSVYH